MATTHNITTKRGDTYDGESFRIKESTIVSVLPTIGDSNVVYYLNTTKVYYIWNGTTYETTTGGKIVDLTGCTVLCQMRQNYNFPVIDTIDVQITDPTAGVLKIMSQSFDMAGGTYLYDIQLTFPNGSVKTYISGTITVSEDVSRA